jgi:CBS-domain-containing membrane protein
MKAIYTEPNTGLDRDINAAHRRVTAVMSSPVRCVPSVTSLADALQTMVVAGLRHLAVADSGGRFIGILSDRAIAAAWAADPAGLASTSVRAVLEPGPAMVRPGAHVLDAARAMRTTGTDAVAVIDEVTGAVVGIVTGSDLIAQLAR